LKACPRRRQPGIWDKLLRFTGNRTPRTADRHRPGQAHRQHGGQAPDGADAEGGEKPDALLLTRERYTAHEKSQGAVLLDGSENASVSTRPAAAPSRATIVGYLGRGEGLVVHTADCAWPSACSTRTASASSPWTGPTSRCALRDRHRGHRHQRQGRAGARGGRSGRLRGRHHARGHGRRGPAPPNCASRLGAGPPHLEAALRHLQRTPTVLRAAASSPPPQADAGAG
jgi:GTP pyrophosphokinase